jgi:hypothetical protein
MGKLSFPTKYSERQTKSGKWYARQKDTFTGMIRKSAERYASREDLVAAMAFGKHLWGKWNAKKK